MKILVFGQSGQVARELARLRPDALFLDRAAADLHSPAACAQAIYDHRPDLVINAAAWTAVDRAEADEEAVTVMNGAAPGAMAQACADLNLPFLHISTDYVFSGTGSQPWRESDPVAPINAYGRSKLAGERAVQAAGGRAIILRTAWVFSAHGNNFVKTMLRLVQSRDQLSVVGDQIGCPTPASSIAATLLALGEALQNGASGGIYHYGGAPETSWAGFARETFARAGLGVHVEDIASSAYPTPAARPLNSRLDCQKILQEFGIKPADWQDELTRVIGELTND